MASGDDGKIKSYDNILLTTVVKSARAQLPATYVDLDDYETIYGDDDMELSDEEDDPIEDATAIETKKSVEAEKSIMAQKPAMVEEPVDLPIVVDDLLVADPAIVADDSNQAAEPVETDNPVIADDSMVTTKFDKADNSKPMKESADADDGWGDTIVAAPHYTQSTAKVLWQVNQPSKPGARYSDPINLCGPLQPKAPRTRNVAQRKSASTHKIKTNNDGMNKAKR